MSKLIRNANKKPLINPGLSWGRVIVRNTVNRPAPREAAASSSEVSDNVSDAIMVLIGYATINTICPKTKLYQVKATSNIIKNWIKAIPIATVGKVTGDNKKAVNTGFAGRG